MPRKAPARAVAAVAAVSVAIERHDDVADVERVGVCEAEVALIVGLGQPRRGPSEESVRFHKTGARRRQRGRRLVRWGMPCVVGGSSA